MQYIKSASASPFNPSTQNKYCLDEFTWNHMPDVSSWGQESLVFQTNQVFFNFKKESKAEIIGTQMWNQLVSVIQQNDLEANYVS